MRDAVHGLVERIGGQVVEHQHGRVVAREVVLERQDLAAIPQRALREQTDFGQAVEHHARRLDRLERLEDALGRLAQLKVGRIEQALLLVLVEQALRRDQFEHLEGLRKAPAVRHSARAQFFLCFGQGYIKHALTIARAIEQELRGDRRLAGAGAAFEQEQPPMRKAACKDFVQPCDTCCAVLHAVSDHVARGPKSRTHTAA